MAGGNQTSQMTEPSENLKCCRYSGKKNCRNAKKIQIYYVFSQFFHVRVFKHHKFSFLLHINFFDMLCDDEVHADMLNQGLKGKNNTQKLS